MEDRQYSWDSELNELVRIIEQEEIKEKVKKMNRKAVDGWVGLILLVLASYLTYRGVRNSSWGEIFALVGALFVWIATFAVFARDDG